jgi:phage gp29-like protein
VAVSKKRHKRRMREARVALNAFGLGGTVASAAPSDGALRADEDRTGMHGPQPVVVDDALDSRRQDDLKDRAAQGDEIARPELIGIRSFWEPSVASGLTPERMAVILQQAIRGDHRYYLQLAEEMEERDPHYFATLSMRKRAVARLKAIVTPASESARDAEIADTVRALVEAAPFREMLRDLVDAYGKGFSAVELVWGEHEGRWQPAYAWRDPKYFTFDYISRSELRLARLDAIDGDRLAAGKWIVYTPKLKSGIPIRAGYARIVAWAWMFKTYTVKDWMAFLDVFGMPIRVGKYHPSASSDDRRKLLQAVSAIAVDAAAIIPETMAIDFIETKPHADKPFQSMGEYMDRQISKAILGQTMTTDEGGSLAQAKIHNNIRIDILEDDGDQLGNVINRCLVDPFVTVNFGAHEKRPNVSFPVAEPEDVAAVVNALSALVPLGLKVSAREARQKVGFSEPDEGEELLQAPAGAKPGKAETPSQLDRAWNAAMRPRCKCCGERVALAAEGVGDELDALVDAGAAEWEPLLDPVFETILGVAKKATSYEEFQTALDAAAGELETAALTRSLAIAALKARALGDVGRGKT